MRMWIIIGAVLVGAVGVFLLVKGRSGSAKETGEQAQTATVERGAVRKTVSADGILVPLTTVEVKSYAGGKIEVLAVDVGDRLKAGDLIARIDPTDSQLSYDQAAAELVAAQANNNQAVLEAGAQVGQTRTSIKQAQASYDAAVKDLEKVKKADHPQEKASVRASVDKARAALSEARDDVEGLRGATQPQELASAQAALTSAHAGLDAAEKDLERIRAASHPQASAQAKSAVTKAETTVALRKKELDRTRALNKDGYVSQSELDIAQSQYDTANAELASACETAATIGAGQQAEVRSAQAKVSQAKAELASAQKRSDTIAAQQSTALKSAESRVTQAKAELTSAEKRLSTLADEQAAELRAAEAKVEQQRAALERARIDGVADDVKRAGVRSSQASITRAQAEVTNATTVLGYTVITAPRDGVILAKYVEEGSMITSGKSAVTSGEVLVDLGDVSTMFVEVDVDEADVGQIGVDMGVDITIEAVEEVTYHGHVTRIDPQATEQSNVTTLKVEIEIEEHDERLVPGMTASCEFLVGEEDDVLFLPRRAIQERDGKHIAYVQTQSGVETRDITIGLQGDDTTEVLTGLNEGESVVIPKLGNNRTNVAAEMRQRAMEHSGAGNFLRK